MTFDVEHSRCDLSKSIDCKSGERPNWIPPSNCKFPLSSDPFQSLNSLGQTETITERTIIQTTSYIFQQETETEPARPLTINPITISSSKSAFSRILLPNRLPIERTPCTFQGTLPDPENCQSRQNTKSIFSSSMNYLLTFFFSLFDVSR